MRVVLLGLLHQTEIRLLVAFVGVFMCVSSWIDKENAFPRGGVGGHVFRKVAHRNGPPFVLCFAQPDFPATVRSRHLSTLRPPQGRIFLLW